VESLVSFQYVPISIDKYHCRGDSGKNRIAYRILKSEFGGTFFKRIQRSVDALTENRNFVAARYRYSFLTTAVTNISYIVAQSCKAPDYK